jgi:membrane protease YdiL (CAAX protease family)
MIPMQPTQGAFRLALLTGWIGLSAAGLLYARQKNIPLATATPLLAAFLVEYSFYLIPGFEPVRERLRTSLSKWQLALGMSITAVAPYLIFSIPARQFRWLACAELVTIIVVVSFWYVVLRPSRVADILFLAIAAAIELIHPFKSIYNSPVKGVDILGHLMLIRTGALAALELRRVHGARFGFIPDQKEWIAGIQYFFYFLPIGFPLAILLGAVRINFTGFLFWKTLAIFFGALWVVALSEEFFFRGLLQQWLEDWTGRAQTAVIAASLIYGAAHLTFRGFPNWKIATVDAVLGWFCGMAYQRTGSIRSSMVTHALVVTLWRTLFI